MTSPSERSAGEGASPFQHPGVDVPTLFLLVVMWAGLIGNFLWMVRDPAPVWVHAVVAIACLNLSFTIWHEGVHGTVFRATWANDLVGVLGALPSMIPYFMIRRVHKLHHDHTNDPERDPDFWFTTESIWRLPLRYAAGVRRTRGYYLATDPPERELWIDRATSVLILALLGWATLSGALWAVLWTWVGPKFVAAWIHAWYVNYLPHRELPPDRYRNTRIVPSFWLSLPMVGHNYHGLHHAWPTVPWHRYARAFRQKETFLRERGAPIHE